VHRTARTTKGANAIPRAQTSHRGSKRVVIPHRGRFYNDARRVVAGLRHRRLIVRIDEQSHSIKSAPLHPALPNLDPPAQATEKEIARKQQSIKMRSAGLPASRLTRLAFPSPLVGEAGRRPG
jgi:hypothetical protein